ncbi:MAG: NAD-dependent epimerase/dehydratase family protein [Candidatus Lokiarchaeota archaeon]|nr:NAD-dependent epimerase/dehydratase family protein [Candidatus Lokiarchaeota archaeon]
MKKNVLIVGGLGYIGSTLYSLIKEEENEWNVEILDNHLYKDITPVHPFIEVDVRDKDKISKNIKNFDYVVNLAAIVGDPACLVDTNLAIEINCIGTRNLSEVCKELNKFIIHISTCSIYGSEPNIIVKEEDEGFPIDFYGQTKYTQERLVRNICENSFCVLRLGTAYGLSPRMRYDLVVNTFAGRAINDKKITVFGGEQERPFVHIKDISRAIIHVINNDIKGIFNIQGQNLSLIKLSEIVRSITKCDVEIKTEVIDKRSYMVDNSKFAKTGFKYKYSIEYAIQEIMNSPTINNMYERIYSNLKLAERLKIKKLIQESKIKIIEGGIAVDDRGSLSFVNDYNFFGVKRFYQVYNFSTSTIRAFHGHLKEAKYVYVAEGSAIVAAVKLDNIESPSKNEKINRYILSEKKPQILFIPPGYANGFKPLEKRTRILFFSTSTLEESKGDDYRYPADYWGNNIWEVENR